MRFAQFYIAILCHKTFRNYFAHNGKRKTTILHIVNLHSKCKTTAIKSIFLTRTHGNIYIHEFTQEKSTWQKITKKMLHVFVIYLGDWQCKTG